MKAFGLGASSPKDILFFAAFLPQFISAAQPLHDQLPVLIVTSATLDLACKLFYALGARSAAGYLQGRQGQVWFNRVSAGLFGAARRC